MLFTNLRGASWMKWEKIDQNMIYVTVIYITVLSSNQGWSLISDAGLEHQYLFFWYPLITSWFISVMAKVTVFMTFKLLKNVFFNKEYIGKLQCYYLRKDIALNCPPVICQLIDQSALDKIKTSNFNIFLSGNGPVNWPWVINVRVVGNRTGRITFGKVWLPSLRDALQLTTRSVRVTSSPDLLFYILWSWPIWYVHTRELSQLMSVWPCDQGLPTIIDKPTRSLLSHINVFKSASVSAS